MAGTNKVLTANQVQLSGPAHPLSGTFHLPASKSESNRALIIRALAGGGQLDNLSAANDTQLMQRLLAESAGNGAAPLDAEDAGTVMRFLTAYLALTGRPAVLTGTARMQERPIGVLVDALRELGARIEYIGQEGFPPLRLLGCAPQAGADDGQPPTLRVRGDISSQYISALLMLGPTLPHGLRLRLTGQVASRPYLRLTLALMRHFGAAARDLGQVFDVLPQPYQPADYVVEADWSAASYAYALVALGAPGSHLTLPGLRCHSWQGDQVIAQLMLSLGVQTEYLQNGVRLTQTKLATHLTHDFTDCPDLAQTVAVVAAAKRIPATLSGLSSLRIKETDRIAALQTELAKFGASMRETSEGIFKVDTESFAVASQAISTYHDHRMAMAFAPLALLGPLQVEAPAVVRKSFPGFWDELGQVGFEVLPVG